MRPSGGRRSCGEGLLAISLRSPEEEFVQRSLRHLGNTGKEWTSVFAGERRTAALLDRITHHVHILEMNAD